MMSDEVEHLQALVQKLRRELQDSREYAQKNKDLLGKAKNKIRQLVEKIRQRDTIITTLKSRSDIRDEVVNRLRTFKSTNDELEADILNKEMQLIDETAENRRQEIEVEIQCKREFLIQQRDAYADLAARAKFDCDTKDDSIASEDTADDRSLWDMDWSLNANTVSEGCPLDNEECPPETKFDECPPAKCEVSTESGL